MTNDELIKAELFSHSENLQLITQSLDEFFPLLVSGCGTEALVAQLQDGLSAQILHHLLVGTPMHLDEVISRTLRHLLEPKCVQMADCVLPEQVVDASISAIENFVKDWVKPHWDQGCLPTRAPLSTSTTATIVVNSVCRLVGYWLESLIRVVANRHSQEWLVNLIGL